MQQYSVFTNEYDAGIEKLLCRRLYEADGSKQIKVLFSNDGRRAELFVNDDAELECLCDALAKLLILDLRYYEIASMVNSLPFSLDDKRSILDDALKKTGVESDFKAEAHGIFDYLKEHEKLNLEGYMHFRLKEKLKRWRIYVDAAADDLFLSSEYDEIGRLLGLFAMIEPIKTERLTVILNPDGSCTIKKEFDPSSLDGDGGFCIDCAPDCNEGVLNMLVNMSPKSIVIHDLSLGKCEKLRAAIEAVFGARIIKT